MNKDENKIEEEFVNTIISNTVSFARQSEQYRDIPQNEDAHFGFKFGIDQEDSMKAIHDFNN